MQMKGTPGPCPISARTPHHRHPSPPLYRGDATPMTCSRAPRASACSVVRTQSLSLLCHRQVSPGSERWAACGACKVGSSGMIVQGLRLASWLPWEGSREAGEAPAETVSARMAAAASLWHSAAGLSWRTPGPSSLLPRPPIPGTRPAVCGLTGVQVRGHCPSGILSTC